MKPKSIKNVFEMGPIIKGCKLPEESLAILSEDSPFDWGNEAHVHTLVYIDNFIDHVEDHKRDLEAGGFEEEVDNLIQWLYKTKEIFGEETLIDLEN